MKIIEERILWFYTPSFLAKCLDNTTVSSPKKWPNKNHHRNGRKIRRMGKHLPPRKLTWNMKMMVSNRNLLFQGFIFRFHVSFPGCKRFPPGFCRYCLCSNFGCFFGHTLCGYTWHFFPSKESSPQKTYEYKKTQEIQIFQIYFHPLHQEFGNLQSMGIQWERSDRQTSLKNLSDIKLFHKNPCHAQLLPKKTLPGRKRDTVTSCDEGNEEPWYGCNYEWFPHSILPS